MEPIKLADGTELVPLEQAEKEALEVELKAVLDKYNATYLPIIKEEKTLSRVSQTAALFLLKIKEIPSPYTDGGTENKIEETPEAD